MQCSGSSQVFVQSQVYIVHWESDNFLVFSDPYSQIFADKFLYCFEEFVLFIQYLCDGFVHLLEGWDLHNLNLVTFALCVTVDHAPLDMICSTVYHHWHTKANIGLDWNKLSLCAFRNLMSPCTINVITINLLQSNHVHLEKAMEYSSISMYCFLGINMSENWGQCGSSGSLSGCTIDSSVRARPSVIAGSQADCHPQATM